MFGTTQKHKNGGVSCVAGLLAATNINGADAAMLHANVATFGLVAIIGWVLTFIYAIALSFSRDENTIPATGSKGGWVNYILEGTMSRIIIGQKTPRWRRWLSLSLTTIMLVGVVWFSNNMSLSRVFAGTPDNHTVAAREGDQGTAQSAPDIAPGFLAEAIDSEIYLVPGEFPESRLLADNYDYADAETPAELADYSQEFYMPYGSFTEEMLYSNSSAQPAVQPAAQPEVVAENSLPFATVPAQCGIKDHGSCAAQAGALEFL